jgi:glycine dehydrogenase subunit 2
MKYNPKVNEEAARMRGFLLLHPLVPEAFSQGALRLMFELEGFLAEITGMDHVTLQPAAGAHGELAGMMMIKASLRSARGKEEEGAGPRYRPRDELLHVRDRFVSDG